MATNINLTPARDLAPLKKGDHLTRGEFERRYAATPDVKKAELIEGVVHMTPPVSTDSHGAPHSKFQTWLGVYESETYGVEAADNATVRLDWDNEPQPDAMLRILPEYGGQSRTVDGYVELAPELIAEIAASTVSYDLHDKKEAYRRNGVKEYIVWRVDDAAIDWFILRDGRFDQLLPDENGISRSEAFPGLWLQVDAMLKGDTRQVLKTLQMGLQSTQHAELASCGKLVSVV